jgi:hypothetical protein
VQWEFHHFYHGFSQLRSSYEESLELLNAYLEHRLKEEVAWQNVFVTHKDEQTRKMWRWLV